MMTPAQHRFSDISPDHKSFELHVDMCNEPPKNINIYEATRSDFFAIVLLVSGEGIIKINLKERKIVKNNLLFLAPDTVKQLVDRSDDASVYKVIFTSKFLLQIGIQQHEIEMIDFISGSGDRIVSLNDAEMEKIKHLIEDLHAKNQQIAEHPFGEDIVQYTFRILLSELAAIGIKHNIGTKKNKTSRKQDITIRFGKLIHLNFKEQRSVKFYAQQLALTPNYLNEIIHEVTGRSASELIDEKVMQEAKLLLKNPRLTIGQVADALHFSSQSFLGKFFKRHLGVSPSEYRDDHLTPAI